MADGGADSRELAGRDGHARAADEDAAVRRTAEDGLADVAGLVRVIDARLGAIAGVLHEGAHRRDGARPRLGSQRLFWTSATHALWCWWPFPASVSTSVFDPSGFGVSAGGSPLYAGRPWQRTM
jgi:hypothetical protein